MDKTTHPSPAQIADAIDPRKHLKYQSTAAGSDRRYWIDQADLIAASDYIRTMSTPAAPGEWMKAVVRDVAELPDRTSPDDAPEMMLVTEAELLAIIARLSLATPSLLTEEEQRQIDMARFERSQQGDTRNMRMVTDLLAIIDRLAPLTSPAPAQEGKE